MHFYARKSFVIRCEIDIQRWLINDTISHYDRVEHCNTDGGHLGAQCNGAVSANGKPHSGT